jgi:hypothetical protein
MIRCLSFLSFLQIPVLATLVLSASTSAHADPVHDEIATLKAEQAAIKVKLQIARAKQSQSKAHARSKKATKALLKARQAAWKADCVAERVGVMPAAEARTTCQAEVPDEFYPSDNAPAVRGANPSRIDPAIYAGGHVFKSSRRSMNRIAYAACEQRVTDECVSQALPDGSTDCDADAGLRHTVLRVCGALERGAQ